MLKNLFQNLTFQLLKMLMKNYFLLRYEKNLFLINVPELEVLLQEQLFLLLNLLKYFITEKQLKQLILAKKTDNPLFAANISFHIDLIEIKTV